MLKLILLVPAAALLLLAGEGIYHAARGRQQVTIACDQFAANRRSPRVLVSGCEINYAGAGYRESGGQIEELFLPARPAGGLSVPAPIVVATRDPAAIALARTVLGGGRAATSEQSLEAMRRVVAQLQMSNVIGGLVRTGFIERLRSRRILSGLAPPIADDAVIVDLHGAPDFVRPGLALVSGALLALIALWPLRRVQPAVDVVVPRCRRRRCQSISSPVSTTRIPRSTQLTEQSEVPTLQADASPKTVPASLPRLLLLALDASSGPEAIEAAPPLGSRAEVVAILRGVIPDLAVGPEASWSWRVRMDRSEWISGRTIRFQPPCSRRAARPERRW